MAQELIGCNTFTLEGLKKVKLCTQLIDGTPITFPLDFILYDNDDGVIQVSINETLQTVTVGNQVMSYLDVESFDMVNFDDERQETRQGIWFNKNITIELPQVQLYCNNQLFDFLFNVDGVYATAQCVMLIEDSVGNKFVIGYDVPAILDSLELTTDSYDTTENKYTLEFNSKSYSRLRRYQNV